MPHPGRSCPLAVLLALIIAPLVAEETPLVSVVWNPDVGDGTYRNPIIHADYSDPDVCRVGDDFYMTASSFPCAPGLPVLQSRDLVHWRLIANALPRVAPEALFATPQPGKGVWAPSIRHHGGRLWIFWGDPDAGIWQINAVDARGPWTPPHLVQAGKGMIDACPFWDDDGRAWVVHGWAASRARFNSVLTVHEMTPDGDRICDNQGTLVFDGKDVHPTVEGPKFYKHDGWYWIFAPAGGVQTGWQLAMRSRDVLGPYEARIVLQQGGTSINGPHQGGWVRTPAGEDWFLHFQDKGPYGRVVHLQPMAWKDGWPVPGDDADGDGKGEPVLVHAKPRATGPWPAVTPAESDDFNEPTLGLQWQWQANPDPRWGFPTGRLGYLHLSAIETPAGAKNLWEVPHLLLQKFPAPRFTATTAVALVARQTGERAGLVVMGLDYASLVVERSAEGHRLVFATCKDADRGGAEDGAIVATLPSSAVQLRVQVGDGALCSFSYSVDGAAFISVGRPFTARVGRWIGAKVGIFAATSQSAGNGGHGEFDWFRVGL